MSGGNLDELVIAYVVRYRQLLEIQRAGIDATVFVDEYRSVWTYILRIWRDYQKIPSPDMLKSRFPDIEIPEVKKRDYPILIHNIKQRKKFIDLMTAMNDVAAQMTSYEEVDGVIQGLQAELNDIAGRNITGESHLIDLFSPEATKKITGELRRRSRDKTGLPSGLAKIDNIVGGFQKQEMVVIMGRTGTGKSWLSLMAVASAVIAGAKVILYPLEMNLNETAYRLYTLFTQKCFGASKALKNHDLSSGRINSKKVARFLAALEDKFSGQLYVADIGSLSDTYTNERIEAEVVRPEPSALPE